ncbi:MAG: hypothetical protein ABI559_06590 [Chloroflexota bacterium]
MNASYPSPLKGLFAQNTKASVSNSLLLAVLSTPAIFVVWLMAMPGGDTALTWFDDSLLFLMSSGAAVATFMAARRYRGTRMGFAWGMISLGMSFMAFGEGAWAFEELILGREVISPAVSDIGYLGFYVPVFLGLLAFPQAPVFGLRRLRFTLDTIIVTSAVALVSWHFLIEGLVGDSGGFSLESVITVAYPVLDLGIVSAAVFVVLRGGRTLTNVSVALLLIGFVSIALSDSVYSYLTQIGEYDTGSTFDVGWVFGYAVITAAAIMAASRRVNLDSFVEEGHRRAPLWQTAVLNTAIILPTLLLFLHVADSSFEIDYVTLIGYVGLVGLVLLRGFILHVEHGQLHSQVEEMAQSLREKLTAERMTKLRP